MSVWLWVIGSVYLAVLALVAYASWKRSQGAEDYLLAGSNIGVGLGFLTYAATLFSTFTLLGMPDFFRSHGVGAWIFLAVSDGAMVFFILWFGFHLRKRIAEKGFRGVAGLMSACYGSRWAGYVYFAGAFLFLVPYVAIQIRGIAVFLHGAFPEALPVWGWAVAIVAVMLLYSEIGGLKAIIYSDAMQGLLLLLLTWFIAMVCISRLGGIESMFAQVQAAEPALLSTPGPRGLFTPQFLLASLFGVLFLPATQPQLTTRLAIMRDANAMRRMAVGVGIFAILVILPTIAIGMYGAVLYAAAPQQEYWAGVLLYEQVDVVAAAVIIGLLAAAMSTADSQIFALGTELRSLMHGEERAMMRRTKLAIGLFAVGAMIFAILSSDELVLLALISFRGTSMLAPMVLAAVLARGRLGGEVIGATALVLALFLGTEAGVIPTTLGPIRTDLVLLIGLALFTAGSILYRNQRETV